MEASRDHHYANYRDRSSNAQSIVSEFPRKTKQSSPGRIDALLTQKTFHCRLWSQWPAGLSWRANHLCTTAVPKGPCPLPMKDRYSTGLMIIRLNRQKEHSLNWNKERYIHTRGQAWHIL